VDCVCEKEYYWLDRLRMRKVYCDCVCPLALSLVGQRGLAQARSRRIGHVKQVWLVAGNNQEASSAVRIVLQVFSVLEPSADTARNEVYAD